ncbi:MAG: ATP synthase F0 subunit B [Proteobacteria bacterium]|nr:ATP synthase F0 subunit B [Pseudomonadota bacterium]
MFGVKKNLAHSLMMVVLFFTAATFFSPSSTAFAAGGHEAADRSGDLFDLLYRFINFALLVIILIWALKKAGLKAFFSARREDIKRRLDDLRKGKEEAQKGCHEIEERLKAFEEERRQILEEFRKEGLAEKERIIGEAKERVKQIIDQSELTIQQEIQAARDRLKEEMVDLAAKKAQEIISREMTDKDQDLLVDDFIERVGKIH